ncbi:MAG TPA: transcription antitermination factor NusB [Octadecabacter sp.]|nr:transcription antitermination factor NusB [Octadecabacter sp.]
MTDTNSNLSGNQRRKMKSASRLYAVEALFQMEHSAQTIDKVTAEFMNYRFGETYDGAEMIDGDIAHFKMLVEVAVEKQVEIDKLTDRALVARWPLGRIDPTLRALFRAAGVEILGRDTPPRVAITEYVDVARAFFDDGDEPKFVNAVLDHMAKEAKPDAF